MFPFGERLAINEANKKIKSVIFLSLNVEWNKCFALYLTDQFCSFPFTWIIHKQTEIYYCSVPRYVYNFFLKESWIFSGLNGEGGLGVV